MSYQFIDGIISQEDGLYHRCPVKQHKVCVPDRRSYRKKSKSPSKINYYVRVMNGSLNKTPGGLTKKDLMYNKKGLIVSKKKSRAGKLNFKYLKSNGYAPKKGVSVEENIKMFKKLKKAKSKSPSSKSRSGHHHKPCKKNETRNQITKRCRIKCIPPQHRSPKSHKCKNPKSKLS